MQLVNGNLTIDSETLYNNGTKVNKGANYTMNYPNGSITFLNASPLWAVRVLIPNESFLWTKNNSAMKLNQKNIVVDSEILYNNGTKINKGTNYTMNYTNGSIVFLNSTTYWNGSISELITTKFNLTYNYNTKELITDELNISYTYVDPIVSLIKDLDYRMDYAIRNFTLINETFNDTLLYLTYNYSVYSSFGNNKQFGINYSYLTYGYNLGTDYTFRLNTSYQKVITNISIGPSPKDIWNWWDFYSCTTQVFTPYVFFAATCISCFFEETQLDNYNIIIT